MMNISCMSSKHIYTGNLNCAEIDGKMVTRIRTIKLLFLFFIGLSQQVLADVNDLAPVPVDKFGVVEVVPANPTAHWLWVYDTNFISFSDGRAHLVDGDSGRYIGTLNTGYVHARLNLPKHYKEMYSAETYYSRHVSGTRTDLVRIYDPLTLSLVEEIEIPNKRATTIPRMSNTGLSENDRFMAIANITPATSTTIVDLQERKFVQEISVPGCTLAIPAGGLSFLSLCADGSALVVDLNDDGTLKEKRKSKIFFSVEKDPILENAVRYGDILLFPSVNGMLYSIDISGADLQFPKPWSMIDDKERADGWRTGGFHQFSVNPSHGLLFSIMHQGPEETYEHSGPEVWVYDIEKKKRIRRIKTERIAASIHVSPDHKPLLFSLPDNEAVLDIYDALSGKHIRSIEELGVTPVLMETPPY